MADPLRGEIWTADFNRTRGHEQAGVRPALVLSANLFNQGPADLIVVLPITRRSKGVPFHVSVDAPEGGLKSRSFIKCQDIRSISKERLTKRWGNVSRATMAAVEDPMRILLEL